MITLVGGRSDLKSGNVCRTAVFVGLIGNHKLSIIYRSPTVDTSTLLMLVLMGSYQTKSIIVLFQVGHCYLQQLASFPQELTEILMNHHTVLEPDLRMVREQIINRYFLALVSC